jgi:hypothetical protein
MDLTGAPEYDDTKIIHLQNGEYEFPDQRTDYRYVKIRRDSEEIREGGWARRRADNNFANLAKFASAEGAVTGGITGASVGAIAGGVGAAMHLNGKLGMFSKFVPNRIFDRAALKGAKVGAGVGALSGATVGLLGKKGNEDEPAHYYITDMGVSVLPKKLGPAELTAAFHAKHPIAKYLPAFATLGTVGGTILSDSFSHKPHSTAKLVAAATAGGVIGSLLKLRQEDQFLDPYKKSYIHQVERKYNQKMAGEPANEYITETNVEMLPFHDTSPADLDIAYRFKHPLGNYAPAAGTLLGMGASVLNQKLKNKPLNTVNTLLHGTIGGVGAALLQQIHKDTVLHPYRKAILKQVQDKYPSY